jgi:adenylate cyclase
MDVKLLEFKAKAQDRTVLRERIAALDGVTFEAAHQVDVFFPCASGRLKLRITAPDQGALIHYQRADLRQAKESDCRIVSTDRPQEMLDVLSTALGERGRVIKERLIARIAGAQIHLDQVDQLGDFVEIEIPRGDSPAATQRAGALMTRLIDHLGIKPSDMIDVAYIDLLEREA